MLLRRLLYPLLLAPATDEGALAAISAAIEDPNAAPPATGGEGDAGNQGAGTSETPSGDGGEAGSGDGGAPPAGAETQGGDQGQPPDPAAAAEKGKKPDAGAPDPEADRGDGRNAAGRFVKKPTETDEQLEARRKADPLDAKAPGAKPPAKIDHVNDPIPQELKGRTRERMESLVATTKELNTKLEAQQAEIESGRELFGLIEATGADSETFARHMDVLSLMCSEDPAEVAKAVTALRAAADKLAGEHLGEAPPGKDVLEGHADLLEEVDAGELTRKRAEEIAKTRNAQAAADRRRTETTQRTEQQTAAEQARAKTKAALNDLTTELRKKDGDKVYMRKHAILVPMIKRLNASLPADKIVQAVREAYNEIKLEPIADAGANGNRAPAGTGNRQPARGMNGAGAGGPKVPSSPLEALEFGLEEHARATGAR